MITLCIIAGIVFVLWMGYSGWASPLMRENEDGSWTTLRPEKKFSDLFKKQTPIKKEDVFVDKDTFQTLAGIKPHNKESAPFNPINNKLNENIVEQLKNDFENSKFPISDDSLNVRTTKITTINTNFGNDNDPLAHIPMSRISKEAKEKMANIAREDIRINTETITNDIMGSIGTKPKTQTDYVREHTPNISKKRKPKTAKENEAEFELGGSE